MERETLGSRLGFILLSAGCAIGIGNVWKFPYLVGQNGGGAFVLVYLLFLAILGVPVMTMEFGMGRAAKKSPVKMYQQLEKKGTPWHIHGFICLIGCVILMMFYTTVAGWMLLYFVKTATGAFAGKDAQAVAGIFDGMLADPKAMLIAMVIIVVLGFFVCSLGLQGGLERVTKIMMIMLLVIMVALAVNSMFLKGAGEGLKFYLRPSIENMKAVGIGNVIVAAMNQAFFTLSLGVGAMAIFGSYIGKDHALMGEAVHVAVLDTFVAIVSGLIIMPACFAYGVEPGAGPGLIFITLPNIFNNMPLGRLWGSLFFVFMTFAAFSTVLAVFENIMACVMDLTGWDRKKTGLICAVSIFILSLPCLLGFNVLKSIEPMGAGSGIMDLEDFIVSNILLPGGSLIFVLFCTWNIGWGWKSFIAEANTGTGLKVAKWTRPYMTVVLPIIILAILLISLGVIKL
ncbi:MAG: sodium-dependent transporter [Blautia sp.]|nr:sodium-dependent transporter [Blautia sp.]